MDGRGRFSELGRRAALEPLAQAMAAFLFRVENPGAAKPTCPAGPGPFSDVASGHAFCREILDGR